MRAILLVVAYAIAYMAYAVPYPTQYPDDIIYAPKIFIR